MMKISDDGLRELIASEGARSQVYDDRTGKTVSSYSQVKGYPTIGVGHLIRDSERQKFAPYLGGGKKMTQYQLMELLRYDVKRFEDALNSRINFPMTQSMWDALVSISFNAGSNSYAVKDAIAKINAGDYTGAAKAILNGPVKSKGKVLEGLVKRRKREAMLFMKDGLPGKNNLLTGLGIVSALGLTAFFGTRYVKEHGVPEMPKLSMPDFLKRNPSPTPVLASANKEEEGDSDAE
jgi:lysozyme